MQINFTHTCCGDYKNGCLLNLRCNKNLNVNLSDNRHPKKVCVYVAFWENVFLYCHFGL